MQNHSARKCFEWELAGGFLASQNKSNVFRIGSFYLSLTKQ